jgi:splicing factor 3A subunit 3
MDADDDDIVQLEEEEEEGDDIPSAQRTNLVVDWEGKVAACSGSARQFGGGNVHGFGPMQPIPYWLYRLHGLSKVYTCEICGDFPYRGPKASASPRMLHAVCCLSMCG